MLRFTTYFLSILTTSSLLLSCAQENPNHKEISQDLVQDQNQNIDPKKLARIAIDSDPLSLDPRLVRELTSINLLNSLYEGLMKIGADQKPEFAIAKSVVISPDLLTYTFTLRDTKWSDGTPLTASDFAETWMSSLNPALPSPMAYMLYAIKGAKSSKEGAISPNEIGVSAPSPTTLIVQLEQPVPYFLELVTGNIYFPVSPAMRQQALNSLTSTPEKLISNGPFKMTQWKQRDEVVVTKNPLYWDAESVALDGIAFQILDDNTALQLFKGGEIDWIGSPIYTLPQDVIPSLKKSGELKIAAAAGTNWIRFNTQKPPFDSLKMRNAFNLAINRKEITEHITQGNQQPATGIVPPSFAPGDQHFFKDHDTTSAQKNYMSALIDLKDEGKNLPVISLCYGSGNDRNRKVAQAVQQQWNKAFGITVVLESCESQVLYDRLKNGNYQMALGSWYADILDPINFLEVFKAKDTPTNNTFWENEQFQKLLEMSSTMDSPEERNKVLAQAEAILVSELPVAPIYYGSYNYLVNPRLEGATFSESGIMNFKHALIKE